jgi:hypothetical protein
MTRIRIAASVSAFALLAGVTLSSAAQAEEAVSTPDAIGDVYAALVQPGESASGEDTLAVDDLADISGGAVAINIEDAALSTQELTANTSNNAIGGDVGTGDIRFSEGAFSNFNGVGNVVVNTGVQANIQGSINVTINGTSF